MSKRSSAGADLSRMDAFNPETSSLNVIIETPKGSRNKFNFDEQHGLFKLGGVLPAGAVFPFDFGFIPSTLGGDGDPLDVLLLMDEPAFAGCLVEARLIGVIEAEQTEREGETERNDRLIAVAVNSHSHGDVHSFQNVNKHLLDEIEHFFVSYNEINGKEFKPTGRYGADRARELVEEGIKRFRARTRPAKGTKKRASPRTAKKAKKR